jgi:nitroimidazol reductase NimA-like FMN-containing flavoprotein (pyridoxamine 5'-phosphate oxidase superfamily)
LASDDSLDAFLSERHNLILAGIRADGRPHVTPNWFYWDGERFYSVEISRPRHAANIARNRTR